MTPAVYAPAEMAPAMTRPISNVFTSSSLPLLLLDIIFLFVQMTSAKSGHFLNHPVDENLAEKNQRPAFSCLFDFLDRQIRRYYQGYRLNQGAEGDFCYRDKVGVFRASRRRAFGGWYLGALCIACYFGKEQILGGVQGIFLLLQVIVAVDHKCFFIHNDSLLLQPQCLGEFHELDCVI